MGLPLAITDYRDAVGLTRAWLEGPPGVRAVAAANTHFVTLSRRDRGFRELLNRFDLIVPDGMPLVWVMNRAGAGMKDRVYGPTLMLHALAQPGIRHFLLGGSPAMLEALERNLKEKFPDLQLVGTHSPPFGPWSEEEDERMIAKIAASGAQYIWIGLGCPKQETWLSRNKDRLPPGVYFAVGAAFPFHSGMVRQAPPWMQKIGMEWFFRLCMEPRRLWKRVVIYNTLFLWHLATDRFRPPATNG